MSETQAVAEALFLQEVRPFIDNGSAVVSRWDELKAEYPEQAVRHMREVQTAIAALDAYRGKITEEA